MRRGASGFMPAAEVVDVYVQVWDAFQQGDASHTREKGGTGLGLSIARHLTAMHGGTITLTSEPGLGSEFRVIVPVRPAEQGERR